MKRIFLSSIVLALASIAILVIRNTPYDPPAWTAEEIRQRVDLLNDIAAQTPHKRLASKETLERNRALFERVERGTELTIDESAEYRILYQGILKDNQTYLRLFDWDLTVLPNVRMSEANNVGDHGISGHHDHHDASARANFKNVESSLDAIRSASGAFASITRIVNATVAYKDLNDVLFHLATAPETKSVGYERLSTIGDPLVQKFETHLSDFKQAQFQPVNSAAYIRNLHEALIGYDQLVLSAQEIIYQHLSPWERTLAGRWGSWQSLMPPIDENAKPRFPRNLSTALSK